MSELTFDERMDRIEALTVKVFNNASQLRNDKELDAVTDQVFNELNDLENRLIALRNNLEMVKKTIATANGT